MKKIFVSSLFAAALIASANAQATFIAGSLSIVTPNTDDEFTVEIGPVAGRVQIFGAAGVPDGQVFLGVTSIAINTRGGYDKVLVRSEVANPPSLNIVTGLGDSELDLDFVIPPVASALSTVRVSGGPTLDKVIVRLNSAAQTLTTNWAVDLGNGLNEGLVFVESPSASQALNFNFNLVGGNGIDRWEAIALSQAARVNWSASGRFGAGNDELQLKGTGNGSSVAAFSGSVDMGLGDDFLNLDMSENASAALNGTWATGAGADTATVTTTGNLLGTGTLNTGDGNDKAIINAFRITGSPSVQMGAGDDLLEMLSNQIATGNPRSDGGLGFDQFKGLGTPINFEQFN